MQAFSPREIVSELDRFIIGQDDAKKAVAIALRNRWRRQQLEGEIKEEILPKNILMVGPTGVGKTEISRRLSKLAQAPFIKVEATKFTEVGYVGRDVEQIVRDLIEIAITMVKQSKRKEVKAKAQLAAEERVLDCLVGPGAGSATRESFRKKLRNQEIDDKEIEIEIQDTGSATIDLQGSGGAGVGMINLNDMLGKAMGNKTRKKKVKVGDSYEILVNEESDKLIDHDQIVTEAKQSVEDNGIVFIDEIDKVCARSERLGGDVSREGVQRDLLPLIEGTVVTTKHGTIKTDHILFIASGAFQLAKPSDLLPELQGRLPIRVALNALSQNDFKRILKEPKFSLIKQYEALMKTEDVEISFTEDGIDALATLAVDINTSIENIGARRLHTILERVLEEISFSASDRKGQAVKVDADYVKMNTSELSKDTDLSKFIL
jgi:ATP-dependent HslUV protease ATP-binding subunit HslU